MTDARRPDEVIAAGRNLPASGGLRELAMFLPNMAKLLGRLIKDPRVPRRSKLLAMGAFAYVASPIDLIPEFIPVIGYADDLILVAYAINHLIDTAGEDVVIEHWDGPQDVLGVVRTILEVSSDLVPPRVKRMIAKLTGD